MRWSRFLVALLAALALARGPAPARGESAPAEPPPSATLRRITEANRLGQVVFVVLYQGETPGLAKAREVATAARGRVAASAVVELDRAVAENADAVARFRVQAAPVPLLLVVAQNGVAVGAVRPADEQALERLLRLVPSPGKAATFQLLAQKRVALIAFARPDMAERGALYEALSEVSKTLKEAVGTVLVDPADPAEAGFAAEWKVPADAPRPVLAVVSAKGQPLGRLEGAPGAKEILDAVKRKAPCCTDPGCGGCQ